MRPSSRGERAGSRWRRPVDSLAQDPDESRRNPDGRSGLAPRSGGGDERWSARGALVARRLGAGDRAGGARRLARRPWPDARPGLALIVAATPSIAAILTLRPEPPEPWPHPRLGDRRRARRIARRRCERAARDLVRDPAGRLARARGAADRPRRGAQPRRACRDRPDPGRRARRAAAARRARASAWRWSRIATTTLGLAAAVALGQAERATTPAQTQADRLAALLAAQPHHDRRPE